MVQHEELLGRARQEGEKGRGDCENVVYQTFHLNFISVESSRMEPSVNIM